MNIDASNCYEKKHRTACICKTCVSSYERTCDTRQLSPCLYDECNFGIGQDIGCTLLIGGCSNYKDWIKEVLIDEG